MTTPVSLVFIHHTAMDHASTDSICSAAVRSIQNYHMIDRGRSLCSYITLYTYLLVSLFECIKSVICITVTALRVGVMRC